MTVMTSPVGARLLERSTDINVEARAGTLAQLFDITALVTMALLHLPLPFDTGETERSRLRGELELLGEAAGVRPVVVGSCDPGMLLVHWLRELTFLAETERYVYTGAVFGELGSSVEAMVSGIRPRTPPLRDVKGVTYHELVVAPLGDDWIARISFDL